MNELEKFLWLLSVKIQGTNIPHRQNTQLDDSD